MTTKFFFKSSLDNTQMECWGNFLKNASTAHYLQSPGWAEVECNDSTLRSRKPFFFWCEDDCGICLTALVIRQSLPLPGRAAYEINKGPVFKDIEIFEQSLPILIQYLRRDGLQIKLSPCWELASGGDDIETILERFGFRRKRILGLWATLKIDLKESENEILQSFRKTTRYEIRKAIKNPDVSVGIEDNEKGWRAFCKLQKNMSKRTNTGYLSHEAVERLSRFWLRNGEGGTILIMRYKGSTVGGAIIIRSNGVAIYKAGASDRAISGLSTSHMLLWEAIKWAKNHQCYSFDMGGYSLVARPGDALWGINIFKKGFSHNATPVRFVANHILVLNRPLYWVWILGKFLKQRLKFGRG